MGVEGERAPDSDAPRALGKLLAGRYRIQNVLGEGGMAIVYEGEHVAIGKRVAIKLVQSFFAKDGEVVQRFEHEARSASAVESEHIVHVFDAGADPALGLFLVMELLKGEDLSRFLESRGRLDPVFACGIVHQAALGLEKAHAAGVVHRDLKPANVFLVERDDGTTLVKLVDFGIAKIVRDAEDARLAPKGITRRGTAIGTPQYMSPEQAQASDTVDHRTDVYSLGAVLFEAIAGQPHLPERATYEQTILQLVSTRAPRLSSVVPDVPPALDDLVAAMLDHDVEARVPDMRTVRERLDAIYPGLRGAPMKLKSLRPAGRRREAAQQPTVPSVELDAFRPRRRRSVIAIAGLAVILGVALGMMLMWRTRAGASPEGIGRPPRASVSSSVSAAPPLGAPLVATARLDPPPDPALTVPTAAVDTAAAPPAAAASSAPSSSAASRPRASATGVTRRAPPPGVTQKSGTERGTEQVGAAGISSQF
jgi:serine/threonine-protein kinase